MTEQASLDDLTALKDWLRDSGAPAPRRPHSSVEMAVARAEIEAERVDDLAEAERAIRSGSIPLSDMREYAANLKQFMAEFDRQGAELEQLRARVAEDKNWNEAIDWLLNSRHTADPDIQGPFWDYVDGKISLEELRKS